MLRKRSAFVNTFHPHYHHHHHHWGWLSSLSLCILNLQYFAVKWFDPLSFDITTLSCRAFKLSTTVVPLIALFENLLIELLLLCPSPPIQLIQSDLDDEEDERLGVAGGRGTLRFKHKLPVELKGPEGVHVVHGSSGTLITSDLNSLPEDDQRALARSLEALNVDGALYAERNARTESAKSTPMHRHKDGDALPESPLEITEL